MNRDHPITDLGTRAVEPDLLNPRVSCQNFAELIEEVCVVFRRVAIAGFVAVPRRDVDAVMNPFRATCVDELADQKA